MCFTHFTSSKSSRFSAQATVKVHAQQDNVAGVKIPKFERLTLGTDTKMNLTGLGAGGQQIQQTRKVAPLASLSCN